MNIYVLNSGSRGNATLFEDDGHLYLIDMGVPLFVLKEGLEKLNHKMIDIEAMFLTHEHYDHTKGIQYLDPLPIYTTKGTWDAPNVVEITPYKSFKINNLTVTPVSLSHDVVDPVGFIFENKEEKFVYITDTGYIPSKTLDYLANADYYVMESNYDYKMLLNCGRPMSLVRRISSETGHLSNKDSARYMVNLIGEKTKQIILAHISLESNSHEVALATYEKIFKKAHISLDKIQIICADQFEMTLGGKANQ